MTKERIEIIRQSLIPFVKKELLEINNDGLGKSDAEEFEKDLNEVLDMAIKLLEQQPCEDCVSRAEVNKLYDEYRPRLATHVSEFGDKLKALPSITPSETMPDNEQKVLVSPCFGSIF